MDRRVRIWRLEREESALGTYPEKELSERSRTVSWVSLPMAGERAPAYPAGSRVIDITLVESAEQEIPQVK